MERLAAPEVLMRSLADTAARIEAVGRRLSHCAQMEAVAIALA